MFTFPTADSRLLQILLGARIEKMNKVSIKTVVSSDWPDCTHCKLARRIEKLE